MKEIISEHAFSRRRLLECAKGKILEVGVGTGKNFPFGFLQMVKMIIAHFGK